MMKQYFIFLLAVFMTACSQARTGQISEEDAPLATPGRYSMIQFREDAPPLYPWLLTSDSLRADWLGIRFNGKILHEPINILLSDGFSSSEKEAENKLLNACTSADFLDRYGHSSDYLAFVDGKFTTQYPRYKKHSFADKVFLETNNHGRIFGPVLYKRKYWFAAAFSREKVHIDPVGHLYVSFNQARDSFAWKLDATGAYKVKKFINLRNVIMNSESECSGDHDGIAVYLEAVK
jgi:hypothetical protein